MAQYSRSPSPSSYTVSKKTDDISEKGGLDLFALTFLFCCCRSLNRLLYQTSCSLSKVVRFTQISVYSDHVGATACVHASASTNPYSILPATGSAYRKTDERAVLWVRGRVAAHLKPFVRCSCSYSIGSIQLVRHSQVPSLAACLMDKGLLDKRANLQLEQCGICCSLRGETRPNTGVASPIGTRYGTQLLQHTRALSLRKSQEQRSCGVALRRINQEPGLVAEYNYIKWLILGKIYLLPRAVFTPVTAVLTERAFIRLDSRGACRPQFCLPKSILHCLSP